MFFSGLRRLDDSSNTEMSSMTGVSDCGHVFTFRFGDYKGQMLVDYTRLHCQRTEAAEFGI
jgi:hypothetical protein